VTGRGDRQTTHPRDDHLAIVHFAGNVAPQDGVALRMVLIPMVGHQFHILNGGRGRNRPPTSFERVAVSSCRRRGDQRSSSGENADPCGQPNVSDGHHNLNDSVDERHTGSQRQPETGCELTGSQLKHLERWWFVGSGQPRFVLSAFLGDASLVDAPLRADTVLELLGAGAGAPQHHQPATRLRLGVQIADGDFAGDGGQDRKELAAAGLVVKVRPLGEVYSTVPSANCLSAQPPTPPQNVLSRWWHRLREVRSSGFAAPSLDVGADEHARLWVFEVGRQGYFQFGDLGFAGQP